MKTTIQVLYDNGLFDIYEDADEVIKQYLLIAEVSHWRRPDLEELNGNNNVTHCFYS